jgi:hypothetical protein
VSAVMNYDAGDTADSESLCEFCVYTHIDMTLNVSGVWGI